MGSAKPYALTPQSRLTASWSAHARAVLFAGGRALLENYGEERFTRELEVGEGLFGPASRRVPSACCAKRNSGIRFETSLTPLVPRAVVGSWAQKLPGQRQRAFRKVAQRMRLSTPLPPNSLSRRSTAPAGRRVTCGTEAARTLGSLEGRPLRTPRRRGEVGGVGARPRAEELEALSRLRPRGPVPVWSAYIGSRCDFL